MADAAACPRLCRYCECFAAGHYCDNCCCIQCLNNQDSEPKRQQAVDFILERNPLAFQSKIQVCEGGGRRGALMACPSVWISRPPGCSHMTMPAVLEQGCAEHVRQPWVLVPAASCLAWL